jgi:predicted Fe-Mo cluster-binding NifX family protein
MYQQFNQYDRTTMTTLMAAFATNDGLSFTDNHFGEADHYLVYRISPSEAIHVKTIKNTTEEEEVHADPRKAQQVGGLLGPEKIQVLVNRAFGGNINRIKKKFVVVLTNQKQIPAGVELVRENFDTIVAEWEKGESRTYLKLRTKHSDS